MIWFKAKQPILALAPMADMTDGPFCRVCRKVAGKNFVIFREMISAEALVRGNEKSLRRCAFETSERPIVLQIFGGDPKTVAAAAAIIVKKFHPDGIDVNMGCPVPKIAGKGRAGACLMKDAPRAEKIVRALKGAGLGVPVSVKTRLGWNNSRDILDFAPRLEAAGADALTVHGRTRAQGYAGAADWAMIKEIKQRVSIPVLANGDIKTKADIKRCLEITCADGVMIGRGALGNPWIFKDGKRTVGEIKKIALWHARAHVRHYGAAGIVTFRKHLPWYFKGVLNIKEVRNELVRIKSLSELKKLLQKIPS